jgi:hypothetical protein
VEICGFAENGGIPKKWMVYKGKSIYKSINNMDDFYGYPFMETSIC